MVTEISPKIRETAEAQLKILQAEVEKLRKNQKTIEVTQAYVYLKKAEDSDTRQVLIKLLMVDPRTEYPIKDPAKTFKGADGKEHNEYKVAKWLHADQVWIEEIKVKNNNLQGAMDASFYFCGNYFNQQPVVRQSSSWNWIFRGSQSSWARGKKILGIKPKLIELQPFTYADDAENDIKTTAKHEKTNVLGYRKSIIAVFMESRKSLRRDSGYNNALTYWLTLTRNPPKSSYQKKLANVRLGAITYAYA